MKCKAIVATLIFSRLLSVVPISINMESLFWGRANGLAAEAERFYLF